MIIQPTQVWICDSRQNTCLTQHSLGLKYIYYRRRIYIFFYKSQLRLKYNDNNDILKTSIVSDVCKKKSNASSSIVIVCIESGLTFVAHELGLLPKAARIAITDTTSLENSISITPFFCFATAYKCLTLTGILLFGGVIIRFFF